jgi:hypothetical protein
LVVVQNQRMTAVTFAREYRQPWSTTGTATTYPSLRTHRGVGWVLGELLVLGQKRSKPDIDVLSAVAKLAGEDQGISPLDMDSCIQSFKEKVLSAIWRKRRG